MTSLQQMAFDRLGNINEECRKVLPRDWSIYAEEIRLPKEDFHKLADLLFEQQGWIEALWDEERKDGCEEML